MIFTEEHTNPMSWEEFQSIVDDLTFQLDSYQKDNSIKFDLVAPIMRSGSIPATMIANKLQIVPMVPVQVGHQANKVSIISKPSAPEGVDCQDPLNILIIETNCAEGASAKVALSLLKDTFSNAKFHFACVCKVYGLTDIEGSFESYRAGIATNEAYKLSDEEAAQKGVRSGITIFPWEVASNELDTINGIY